MNPELLVEKREYNLCAMPTPPKANKNMLSTAHLTRGIVVTFVSLMWSLVEAMLYYMKNKYTHGYFCEVISKKVKSYENKVFL